MEAGEGERTVGAMAEENGRAEERSEAGREVTGSRENPVLVARCAPIGTQHATNSCLTQQPGATGAQPESLKALALKVLARNKQAQQAQHAGNNVVAQPSKTLLRAQQVQQARNSMVTSPAGPL
jgi:hypothetical protein